MSLSATERILSQMTGDPLTGLRRADALWRSPLPVSPVIREADLDPTEPDWDVAIAGATLGVIIGTALAQRGWRVVLIERGALRGRDQEWNISRQELSVLVRLGLLSEAELEGAIASQYNPARIAFHGGPEFWVNDVLNLGVDPVYLLDCFKQKFLAAGGRLIEHNVFVGATVGRDGVEIELKDVESGRTAPEETAPEETAPERLSTRLLLDMMGHFSPIARQARQGQTPDGVCLVVGTCATGFERAGQDDGLEDSLGNGLEDILGQAPQDRPSARSNTADLMYSFTPLRNQCQYFWEAFPARDGRTTYLFTYVDAHPDRPSLEALFNDYFELMPQYQQVELEQLTFRRALFGILPSYRNSPLKPAWNRILQVGDSSGTQSPLSFGGFGALLRHLDRLVLGLDEALRSDCLTRSDLSLLNGYQPNLSVTWLFQRAMSVGLDQKVAPNQINDLLSTVFRTMDSSGEAVLKPFLQDVVQFPALAQTLLKTGLAAPGAIAQVIPQVGLPALLRWSGHYGALAGYGLLNAIAPLALPGLEALTKSSPAQQLRLHQWRDLLHYGSGSDYDG